MARSPSARALSNRVDLYHVAVAQDEDGGRVASYGSPFATAVPCSVQPGEPVRYVDETTGRLVQKSMYTVFFRSIHALRLDDRIVWVDTAGFSHSLYVLDEDDQAGKGGCFAVSAEERV